MTPKSLLRHKRAVSAPDELSGGKFYNVIGETHAGGELHADNNIARVVLCAGKVYYDLTQARGDKKLRDIVILRIEQLHPFPGDELRAELQKYANAREVVWCQEEPKNQGSWYQLKHHLRAQLQDKQTLHYVGRDASASPAVGYYQLHLTQQQQLVERALAKNLT